MLINAVALSISDEVENTHTDPRCAISANLMSAHIHPLSIIMCALPYSSRVLLGCASNKMEAQEPGGRPRMCIRCLYVSFSSSEQGKEFKGSSGVASVTTANL